MAAVGARFQLPIRRRLGTPDRPGYSGRVQKGQVKKRAVSPSRARFLAASCALRPRRQGFLDRAHEPFIALEAIVMVAECLQRLAAANPVDESPPAQVSDVVAREIYRRTAQPKCQPCRVGNLGENWMADLAKSLPGDAEQQLVCAGDGSRAGGRQDRRA